VRKPSTFKLTNGDIASGKANLKWMPDDDDDSVTLPALPMRLKEEVDPVEKHVAQACPPCTLLHHLSSIT
jgi:hypothetical protein